MTANIPTRVNSRGGSSSVFLRYAPLRGIPSRGLGRGGDRKQVARKVPGEGWWPVSAETREQGGHAVP